MRIRSLVVSAQFIRYCFVGGLNTLVHILVVILLVETVEVSPPPANAIAFFIANLGSYAMNSIWTFQAPMNISRYGRFVVVSLAGLLVSYECSVLALRNNWHYLAGVFMAVAVVSVMGYLLGRLLVFHGRSFLDQ